MRIHNLTENQQITNANWTTVFEIDTPGTQQRWAGFVFQIDDSECLLRLTVNGEVQIDADLEAWGSNSGLDLDGTANNWIRQYGNNRWCFNFPDLVFADRVKIELKHKTLNNKKLVSGFVISQDR